MNLKKKKGKKKKKKKQKNKSKNHIKMHQKRLIFFPLKVELPTTTLLKKSEKIKRLYITYNDQILNYNQHIYILQFNALSRALGII